MSLNTKAYRDQVSKTNKLIRQILENLSRRKAKYHLNSKGGFKQKEKIRISGSEAYLAFIFCFLIFFIRKLPRLLIKK